MAIAQQQMIQLNVRVDAEVKRQAEEVLELMGSSVTELVRMALEKVSHGARDYVEARDVLSGTHRSKQAAASDEPIDFSMVDARLAKGWKAADDLYRSLGLDPSSLPKDERSWDAIYEEAMDAHFEEKGLLL